MLDLDLFGFVKQSVIVAIFVVVMSFVVQIVPLKLPDWLKAFFVSFFVTQASEVFPSFVSFFGSMAPLTLTAVKFVVAFLVCMILVGIPHKEAAR